MATSSFSRAGGALALLLALVCLLSSAVAPADARALKSWRAWGWGPAVYRPGPVVVGGPVYAAPVVADPAVVVVRPAYRRMWWG